MVSRASIRPYLNQAYLLGLMMVAVGLTLSPFVMALAHGGGNFYDGWMKNPKSAMISCNDGFRPVSFLLEALEEKVGASNLKELHNRGYLYSMDMFPSENFILGDDAITFIYNPYEIAPYEKGCIELKIAYDAIDNILNIEL